MTDTEIAKKILENNGFVLATSSACYYKRLEVSSFISISERDLEIQPKNCISLINLDWNTQMKRIAYIYTLSGINCNYTKESILNQWEAEANPDRKPISCPDGRDGCLVQHFSKDVFDTPEKKKIRDLIELARKNHNDIEDWKSVAKAEHDHSEKLRKVIQKKDEALEFIIRPEKLDEHGDPWFYRKSTAEEALAITAENVEQDAQQE